MSAHSGCNHLNSLPIDPHSLADKLRYYTSVRLASQEERDERLSLSPVSEVKMNRLSSQGRRGVSHSMCHFMETVRPRSKPRSELRKFLCFFSSSITLLY